MNPMMEVRHQVREFLAQAFPGRTLTDDADLFANGFANSLFAMQLVEWLESAFAIVVEAEDLDMDNFRSVTCIATLVERKQAGCLARTA